MASAVSRGRLHQTVQSALMQVIGDWVALHTLEEVLAAMAEARVPSGLCCHPSLGCLATHCGKVTMLTWLSSPVGPEAGSTYTAQVDGWINPMIMYCTAG